MPCSMCTFHLGGEDDGKPSTSGLQPNVKLHTSIKLREHQLMLPTSRISSWSALCLLKIYVNVVPSFLSTYSTHLHTGCVSMMYHRNIYMCMAYAELRHILSEKSQRVNLI